MFRNGGGPGQSRTADQRFRKPLLYPSELRGHLCGYLLLVFQFTTAKFDASNVSVAVRCRRQVRKGKDALRRQSVKQGRIAGTKTSCHLSDMRHLIAAIAGNAFTTPFPGTRFLAQYWQSRPDVRGPMKVRAIFWTVAMAYTGFLLTGQGLRTFNSLSVTEGFLGALEGFLLAAMFTLREKRRRRPALIAYSIAQILPNWDIFPENRGSGPKLKH